MAGPFTLFGGIILTALGIGINNAQIDRTREQKQETKRRNEIYEAEIRPVINNIRGIVDSVVSSGFNSRGESVLELMNKWDVRLEGARLIAAVHELEDRGVSYTVPAVAAIVHVFDYDRIAQILANEKEKAQRDRARFEKEKEKLPQYLTQIRANLDHVPYYKKESRECSYFKRVYDDRVKKSRPGSAAFDHNTLISYQYEVLDLLYCAEIQHLHLRALNDLYHFRPDKEMYEKVVRYYASRSDSVFVDPRVLAEKGYTIHNVPWAMLCGPRGPERSQVKSAEDYVNDRIAFHRHQLDQYNKQLKILLDESRWGGHPPQLTMLENEPLYQNGWC